MEGMLKLEDATAALMDEALKINDWKSSIGETIMAYRGGQVLETETGEETMSKTAAGQLFRMIGLPIKVLDQFNDAPELQVAMARHKLSKLDADRRDSPILCRGKTSKGHTIFDAFLSQNYVPISNFQILQYVTSAFRDMGVEAYAHKAQLHNRQLALRIVAPEWYHDLGTNDIAYTGLAIINDELGKSCISFQAAIARVACFNYTIHSEPVFEHSHRWLAPDQIIRGIGDGINKLNDLGDNIAERLREMRSTTVDDVANMIRISGQEMGMPAYAIDAGVGWWQASGAQENLFAMVQAVQYGADTMTERKGFHWWRRQRAEQQIYDMGKKFQETGRLELCTCPSCHRPMNIIDMEE